MRDRHPPADFEALRSMTREQLVALGCRVWDESGLMLFPGSWFDSIPDGFQVRSILGRSHAFSKKLSRDLRHGALAFGIVARPCPAPRFKVWTFDPSKGTGTLLLRTGSSETLDCDVTFVGETPALVARAARERSGHAGYVHVKNFDTGAWHMVSPDGVVEEWTVPMTPRIGEQP